MTATVTLLTHAERIGDPETQALWAKYDRIGNTLRDLAQELGVIYWSATGLAEVISDGEKLRGIERLAGRLESELQRLAEEVRL